jgi:hypothetical protein
MADASNIALGLHEATINIVGAAPHNDTQTVAVTLFYTDQPPRYLPFAARSG